MNRAGLCRTSSLRMAQRQFLGLVIFVVVVCLLLELEIWPDAAAVIHAPHPVAPRLYLSCECGPERRLGNTMFSFAATIGIAQSNNMTAIVDRQSPLVDTFRLVELTSSDLDNSMGYSYAQYHEYGRRGCAYDRATRDIIRAAASGRRTHVMLKGYFQSWLYFEDASDRVRRNFRFHERIESTAGAILEAAAPRKWTENNMDFVRVGVHVRRGDLLEHRLRDYGYTVAPPAYFKSAMMYFVDRYSRVQFVVCSDDIRWSRDNLPQSSSLGADVDVVFSEGWTSAVDLAVLARCDHVIVSVGSFGWWAAWLANGTTIYYSGWPRPFSMLEYNVNVAEYFPKHWIPMK